MNAVTGLPYRATPSAKILILGSIPGAASLAAGEYYANSRNHFWRIAGALFDFDPSTSYDLRMQALNDAGIAVWDVLHSCVRPGSLDSSIQTVSQVVNDFDEFFTSHPSISLIGFNGAKAEKVYTQRVLPKIGRNHIRRVLLPSTSPAHAAMPFERKLSTWRSALTSTI